MMDRLSVLMAVALGGGCGAVARYGLSSWMIKRFPLGTLAANLTGCLLVGLIVGSLQHREWLSPAGRHFLIMGFLGSLTTFSTFGYQSIQLLEEGDFSLALLNVFTNLCLGLPAVGLGLWVGRWLIPAG